MEFMIFVNVNIDYEMRLGEGGSLSRCHEKNESGIILEKFVKFQVLLSS
jgi:hypothetical protein